MGSSIRTCVPFPSSLRNLNRSPMRLHDLLALIQPDAQSARPAGLRRSKQRLKHARGNSTPRIVNRDDDGTVQLFDRDRDVPFWPMACLALSTTFSSTW